MSVIQYDSTDLFDTNKLLQIGDHASTPSREINALPLAMRSGSKIVGSQYTMKDIVVQGVIWSTTESDFQQKVDELKELLSRPGKYLDFPWRGNIRRYKCICSKNPFTEEIRYTGKEMIFNVEFLAYEGFGRSSAVVSDNNNDQTGASISKALTITGSHEAMPIITINIDSETILSKIEISTNADSNCLSMVQDFAAGDELIINFEQRTVNLNGLEIEADGNYPHFPPGACTYTVALTRTAAQVDINVTYTPLWL
jgi:hypothetical protein